ncbi:transcription factor bHLH [Forsythia ovata]|uniref:Transcription factor bHLH n=1 Tax=Forsythia ovata TaxID=205694 RepID=A0ABD1TLL6_9LAMI
MVCQGASQTRFKALKHENGIAGRTTIIVRVIACFQPLQNCQAEYFPFLKVIYLPVKYEHYPGYFGWMVTSKELQTSQQFSAWNSPLPTSDRMAPMQLGQNYRLPCSPHSSTFCVDVAFPPCSVSDLPDLNSVQLNGVDGFFKGLPPLRESSSPTVHPYLIDSQCAVPHGLGVSASTIDASHTCRKRFLVVDQSGNHTRLFFNPFLYPFQNQIVSSKTPPGVHASCNEKLAVQVEEESLDEACC